MAHSLSIITGYDDVYINYYNCGFWGIKINVLRVRFYAGKTEESSYIN